MNKYLNSALLLIALAVPALAAVPERPSPFYIPYCDALEYFNSSTEFCDHLILFRAAGKLAPHNTQAQKILHRQFFALYKKNPTRALRSVDAFLQLSAAYNKFQNDPHKDKKWASSLIDWRTVNPHRRLVRNIDASLHLRVQFNKLYRQYKAHMENNNPFSAFGGQFKNMKFKFDDDL